MDVKEKCVHCGEDTSFGSGRFINRIPADADCEATDANGNIIFANNEYREGYTCAECIEIECDRCYKFIGLDEDIGADDCGLDEFEDKAWKVHRECLTPAEHNAYNNHVEEENFLFNYFLRSKNKTIGSYPIDDLDDRYAAELTARAKNLCQTYMLPPRWQRKGSKKHDH